MRKRGMSAADFRDAEERAMQADVARRRELLLQDLNANSLEPRIERSPELEPAPGTDRVDGDSGVKLVLKATETAKAKTKSSSEEHDEKGDEEERATATSEGEGEHGEGCELGEPRALSAMERWPPELRDAWLAATFARTGATPLHVAAVKGYLGVLRCATACLL